MNALTFDESTPLTPRASVRAARTEALSFLRKWPAAFPHMVAIHIDPVTHKKGLVEGRSFSPEDLSRGGLADCYVTDRHGKANLYFTVNSLLVPMTGKPAKTDIYEVSALQIDADVPAGENQEAGVAKLLADVRAFRLPPSVIISSGGGVQAFWILRPEDRIKIGGDITKAEAAECYGRGLEDEFNAMGVKVDPCHNVDRMMRLPGPLNIPDDKKIAKGRMPALAKLVEFTDVTYPLSAFTPAKPKPETDKSGAASLVLSGKYERIEADDPRLAGLHDKWKQMGPEGECYSEYGDDRSRAVMAFAAA